jgi:uncharacterized Zn finger protein
MSRRRYYEYYEYYPRSQPRRAKGGIKAQSRRGGFGTSWWASRWIAVLESFDIGARLGRGRSYARSGQVLSIEIEEGRVTAKVQGSRPKPYDVTIKVKTLTASAWKNVAAALSKEAIFAAGLLAGKMPENIEEAFKEAGVSLFPGTSKDLQTDCSCPDWSNPCKHVAAVYYLLGEEFDRDPFLIFRLRGMDRDKLLGHLHGSAPGESAAPEPRTPEILPQAIAVEHEAFWGRAEAPGESVGDAAIPPVAAALPARLGSFPFWRAQDGFLAAMEEAYRNASEHGVRVFLGEQP